MVRLPGLGLIYDIDHERNSKTHIIGDDIEKSHEGNYKRQARSDKYTRIVDSDTYIVSDEELRKTEAAPLQEPIVTIIVRQCPVKQTEATIPQLIAMEKGRE